MNTSATRATTPQGTASQGTASQLASQHISLEDIVLEDITLNGDQRPRLDRVTLTLRLERPAATGPAEFPARTAIVGFSGAGKTSLLNVLAEFEIPDRGRILRRSSQRIAEDSNPLARRTGSTANSLPFYWVPQDGGLWPHLTVQQHLTLSEDSRSLADEILEQLDLTTRRHAYPGELSQGERSRVAVGRALVSGAELLLMDEPLSHVDPVRKPGYWKVIDHISRRQKMSLVFSSHEPETVLQWSDSVICLHEGRVEYHGRTRELYDAPPSLFTGQFLGPLNWLSSADLKLFLNQSETSSEGISIRPERIEMQAAESAPSELELVSTTFCGSHLQSVIRHRVVQKTLTILHQARVAPAPGSLVLLKCGTGNKFDFGT